MKKDLVLVLVTAIALSTGIPAYAAVAASAVLDQLKTLEGTWTGNPEGTGEAASEEPEVIPAVVHEFQISAAGTVVMETMNPGTDHEMINMYHVDGDDLVLTHYCAGGNQPQMRLDREASSADYLEFDFSGGTNLDPAVDPHIHSANIRMRDDGGLDSNWQSHSGGEPAGEMAFHLTRAAGTE